VIHPTLPIRTPGRLPALSVLLSIALASAVLWLPTDTRAAGVIYVSASATGANSGADWANAFVTLQGALAAAGSGDEIWVAAGSYTPGPAGNREATFQLKAGVAIYGGFAGTESQREQRDWTTNVVTLSGDLNGDDGADFANNGENSIHVVTGATGATLDGVTISGGNADINAPGMNAGGGMYNASSSPTLSNVTFSENSAVAVGAGIYNFTNSSPTLTNVTFASNSAGFGGGMYNFENSNPMLANVTFESNTATTGGGMYNNNSNPTLTNITFESNNAESGGGGMYNFTNSSPALTNVTFASNSAGFGGGGLFNDNSSPTLTNVLFAKSSGGDCLNANGGTLATASSHNLIEDSATACELTNGVNGNIIGQDPLLGPLQNNGGPTLTHALLPGSPAIDAGTNTGCPSTDQRGASRPQGAACDIGAVETDPTPLTVTVEQAATQPDPASAGPIVFTVTFSEPVVGFEAADVTLGGTAGATTATISGSGPTYTVSLSGMTADGTVTATLAANVAQDAAGNGNLVATSADNLVTYQPNSRLFLPLVQHGP
jgi:hypothetical protein